jgi:SAM-dependent methyltransferase
LALRVLRRLARPVRDLQDESARLRERQDVLAAQVEQVVRVNERLVAHQDRFVEELQASYGELERAAEGMRSIVDALGAAGNEADAGPALRRTLETAVAESAEAVRIGLGEIERSLAELRSTDRLTQAMVERLGRESGATGATGAAAPAPGSTDATARTFEHPAPGFDVLYRAFEDRHRGPVERIHDRQREDYLQLLAELPNDDLPVVDLGCGRGELVELLSSSGIRALGVDANLGQLVDGGSADHVEADLFDWLDARPDGSCRAVCSLHVVEHLPLDLQVRLVVEARRVLAPDGLLILETPNVQSLAVGASSFWVDPTHERPVHPAFLTFLLEEAGLREVTTTFLHPTPLALAGPDQVASLVDDLNSLLLGPGDVAVSGRR